MSVPAKSHPGWMEIVTGKKTCELKFLAAKIMLAHVVRTVNAANTSENIRGAINKLYILYKNNESNPAVQDDLKQIFG